MEASTVYYDEHSHKSTEIARKFSDRNPGTAIIAAGEVTDLIVYEKNEKVGFIFPSVKGKLPDSIENLIRRLVIDKQAYLFAFVVGGNHEIRVIRDMSLILKQRGMTLASAYAECILQKFSGNEELQLQKIESDVVAERRLLEEFHHQMEKMKKDDVKKKLRKDIHRYLHRKMKKKI